MPRSKPLLKMVTDEELNRELIVIQGEAYELNLRLMKLIENRKKRKEQEDGKMDKET